jgi:hypothetical protein
VKSEEIVCLPNDVRAGGQVAVEDWKKSALLISKFSISWPNRGVQIERSRGNLRENDRSQDLPVRPASETRSVKPMVKIW